MQLWHLTSQPAWGAMTCYFLTTQSSSQGKQALPFQRKASFQIPELWEEQRNLRKKSLMTLEAYLIFLFTATLMTFIFL